MARSGEPTGVAALGAAVLVLAIAAAARADGVMVYRGRPLFREGPAERGYCDPQGSGTAVECDRALTKVLSGYSYARGYVTGGVAMNPESGFTSISGLGQLRLDTIGAALPGGDFAFAAIEGVLGDHATRRIGVTMVSAEGLFFCRDVHSGALAAPFLGMFSRACATDATWAVDAGLLSAQWNFATHRLVAEWARFGPALELLGNGLGYAHLLRSVEIALPFDVRSVFGLLPTTGTGTSLGVGLRLSGLVRTPQWEGRMTVRYRTALVGAGGPLNDNSIEGEVLVLHNFFLTDALVIQAGLSLRASYDQQPDRTTVIWASAARDATTFAGVHLGWVHEAPDL